MRWASEPLRAATPVRRACYGPVSMEVSDAELIMAIATPGPEGRQAEAALCRRFAPRIHLYGRRHLRDDDRARDLVQAVLLAVLQAARAGRIAEPAHADRFMLGTCRNIASRMRDSEARSAGPAAWEVLETIEAPASWQDAYAHAKVDVGALVRCLGELEERRRQVVTLSFQDECGADEIAERLAMTAGNVRVLRHRAVADLRRCLDGRPAPGQEPRA
jgi:RNA polymerase sigma-70 factor (ECF subfamily)